MSCDIPFMGIGPSSSRRRSPLRSPARSTVMRDSSDAGSVLSQAFFAPGVGAVEKERKEEDGVNTESEVDGGKEKKVKTL